MAEKNEATKNEARVVKFAKEKETKNTVKFGEVPDAGQPPVIGTLYVQKWFAGDREEISITIQ